MKRILLSLLSLAGVTALTVPPSAHAALGTKLGEYKLSAVLEQPTGFTPHLSLKLPAGVYDITAIGTYVYGTIDGHTYQADAACTDGGFPAWHDPLDAVQSDLGLDGTFSSWHINRYSVSGDALTTSPQAFYNGNPFGYAQSIYVNGQPAVWVPTFPTVSGDTLPSGCNTTTHQYDTIVTTDGSSPVVLNIYDLNYNDNADLPNLGAGNGPGLTIQVGRLVG